MIDIEKMKNAIKMEPENEERDGGAEKGKERGTKKIGILYIDAVDMFLFCIKSLSTSTI